MRSISVIVLVALVAAVCAQPFTIIQSGNTTRYLIPPSNDFEVYERRSLNLAIFVPANTAQVTYNITAIAFNSTTEVCGDPDVRVSSGRDVGCFVSGDDYSGNSIVPCNNIRDFTVTEGELNAFNSLNADDGLEDFHFGNWWFFSTQEDTFFSDTVCVYDIIIAVETCPTGQVSVTSNSGSGIPECITPTPILANSTFIRFNNTATAIFVSNFATGVDSVTVTYNTTDNDVTLSLWPGAPVRFDTNNICDFDTFSDQVNTVSCSSIPAGPFYIVVETGSSEGGDNAIQLQANICPAGTGGINCAAPIIAWNSSLVGGSLPTGGGAQNPSHIYYVDFAVNSSVSLNITVSVSNDNGDPRLLVKKGFWPYLDTPSGFGTIFSGDETSISAADPATIYFRSEDSYLGGRWYFAVMNDGASAAFNYTFSSTSVVTSTTGVTGVTGVTSVSSSSGVTSVSSTGASSGVTSVSSTGTNTTAASTGVSTGASSTGASTGAASTGATTTTTGKSAASSVVVSVFLIVATVLALLF